MQVSWYPMSLPMSLAWSVNQGQARGKSRPPGVASPSLLSSPPPSPPCQPASCNPGIFRIRGWTDGWTGTGGHWRASPDKARSLASEPVKNPCCLGDVACRDEILLQGGRRPLYAFALVSSTSQTVPTPKHVFFFFSFPLGFDFRSKFLAVR